MLLDPILLARIQFAFTISFHIIFPAFTIGLASFLAFLEWRWLATSNPHYRDTYQFLVKIFAVTFGMGVVSGVVMSYQIGTNWSMFSDRVGNIIGPLLGYEVLTAFFLEASFLGIMLFGWKRVSPRMHFFATCVVAIGTLISAFWILAANSWMQTPQGFEMHADGRLFPLSWTEIIFNPSFFFRLPHMVIAAFLTTSLVVGGIGAYYLWHKRHLPQAKIMLRMATLMVALAAPLQMVVGDLHGLNTLKHQPAKVAAMEGIWETERGAALRLFAWPDATQEKNLYELKIPYLSSWILTHHQYGKIKGLKAFPPQDRPPVWPVFWAFRVMVGLGILMIALGLISSVAYFRGTLYQNRWLQGCWMLMMPGGFVALLAGWFVNEIGRQPYTVYGVLRTVHSASPAIVSEQIVWSLLAFVLMYLFIFGAASFYILQLIAKGIPVIAEKEQFYAHGTESAIVQEPGE
ncbi:MAG: cytochrome ubiquinol oxidase subunit I [Legionella sp.]|nr:MAG: cytochrome ubiquinol oxidase subunit I [Legionella sp.]